MASLGIVTRTIDLRSKPAGLSFLRMHIGQDTRLEPTVTMRGQRCYISQTTIFFNDKPDYNRTPPAMYSVRKAAVRFPLLHVNLWSAYPDNRRNH
jgi:hypothetical protein